MQKLSKCVAVGAAAGVMAGLLAVPAQAMCTAGSPPIVTGLQSAISDDPARALRTIETRLTAPGLNRIDRAWLLATRALAYSTLENSVEETRAAKTGLKLAPNPADAPHIELLAQLAFAQSDPAVRAQLFERIKTARTYVTPGSITDMCSRAVMGQLTPNPVEAAREMGTAYRMAMQAGLDEQRAMIAIDLAGVLMKAGDFEAAKTLVAEGTAFAQKHDLKFLKASTAMRAGTILVGQKNFSGTLPYFTEAFRISQSIGNTRFAAFAAQSACQSYISLGEFRRAEATCNAADQLFGGEKISAARMLSYRGRIALGLKRYGEAVSLLTQQITGAASIATSPAKPFLHRARAYAGLGRWHESAADYAEYIKRFEKETEALKSRDAATLRTQVEVDRQIDQNKTLAREVALEQERASYARQRTWAIATGAALLIAMLLLFLWLGTHHRRALQRLATVDALTGIANRRHATEQGTVALARATDGRTSLTLALIDIDHFKRINDTHGHAMGDEALRNLSAVLKETVRRSDIVGRWGGEEFLVVLPGLDALEAVAVTDRIRAAAAALDFPLRFSAGVATAVPRERDLETMVARADAALYEAKRAGRNRSVIAADPVFSADDRRGVAEPVEAAWVVNG